jgi:lipopolysaccharide biosynthesis glycosyltransferase
MIEVVLASDRNLIRQLGITAMSAVACTAVPIRFHLLTPASDVDHPDWQNVRSLLEQHGAESVLVPVQFLDPSLQLAEHLTAVTYYRLLLPTLLSPATSRVIYLDCDVLVSHDLAPLWRTDLAGCAIGAVEDVAFPYWARLGLDPSLGYFNAGVLLVDLQQVRTDGSFHQALEFATHNHALLTWSDQCALNKVFAGRWCRLDKRWNYQHASFLADVRALGLRRAQRIAGDAIVHFNSYDRPWLFESAHPVKARYHAVARQHPALQLPRVATLRGCWKRLKRSAKWRLIDRGLMSA